MIFSVQISIDQPYMVATLFMVMMVVLSFSFIATMLRALLLLGICTAVFLYSSFSVKTAAIATQDLYNSIIFLTLSIGLHFAFQRARVQQFITYQKNIQIQRELEIQSSFDALTSLLNRGRFFSLAGNILNKPHDEYMAICLLDLDEFKQINDKLGHQMGDKAIQIAGQTIIDTLGIDMAEKWAFQDKVITEGVSFPGRLGGDEFIVLIKGKKNREEVTEVLQQMLQALNAVEIGELHGIHASFGVTEITREDMDIDEAYKRADEALYESKRAGKNQIRFVDIAD
jgi:diguanylate cyclase (GGDEF)-like protein